MIMLGTLHPAQKQIVAALKMFINLPNTAETRSHVISILDSMGFHRVICNENNNPPEIVDQEKLIATVKDGLYSCTFTVVDGKVLVERYKPLVPPAPKKWPQNALSQYNVVCDSRNNSPESVNQGKLIADIHPRNVPNPVTE